MKEMKFEIGDIFLINNSYCTIKDYVFAELHAKRNDWRTKKVSTKIWCLFDEQGREYRKTDQDLIEMCVIGLKVNKEIK